MESQNLACDENTKTDPDIEMDGDSKRTTVTDTRSESMTVPDDDDEKPAQKAKKVKKKIVIRSSKIREKSVTNWNKHVKTLRDLRVTFTNPEDDNTKIVSLWGVRPFLICTGKYWRELLLASKSLTRKSIKVPLHGSNENTSDALRFIWDTIHSYGFLDAQGSCGASRFKELENTMPLARRKAFCQEVFRIADLHGLKRFRSTHQLFDTFLLHLPLQDKRDVYESVWGSADSFVRREGLHELLQHPMATCPYELLRDILDHMDPLTAVTVQIMRMIGSNEYTGRWDRKPQINDWYKTHVLDPIRRAVPFVPNVIPSPTVDAKSKGPTLVFKNEVYWFMGLPFLYTYGHGDKELALVKILPGLSHVEPVQHMSFHRETRKGLEEPTLVDSTTQTVTWVDTRGLLKVIVLPRLADSSALVVS